MNVSEFVEKFETRFHSLPRIFRAPGRVNLIGEHTDYNDGFVLPAAIGFSTFVAVAPRADRHLVIQSEQFPEIFNSDLSDLPKRRTGNWCDYIVGVATVLQQQGFRLPGATLLVHGEVPIGAGLSSSAAVEVASALALLSTIDVHLPIPELAKLCRRAENTFVGAQVGIMDQFVSCAGKAGHAVLLDCRTLSFEPAPIPPGIQLVVCNTMVKHDLATGTYNVRRAECEEAVQHFTKWDPGIHALRDVTPALLERHASELPSIILNRCSHVILENQRTLQTVQALKNGSLAQIGQLMRESHVSLRDLYEVSCRELDIMVDAAQDLPGFIGGRMTGGGFGGCTVNLVRRENANEFTAQISERFHKATGITPQVYVCSAEDGAQQLFPEF